MASTQAGEAGPQLSFTVIPVLLETALFGMYTLLLTLTVFILVRKDLRSAHNAYMLVIVVVMYACAAGHWSTSLFSLAQVLDAPHSAPETTLLAGANSPTGAVVTTVLIGINMVLSDAIVLWRAHVLWGRNRALLCVSGFLLMFTFTVLFINIVALIRNAAARSQIATTGRFGVIAALGALTSLISNVWASSLVGFKAWYFRRDIVRILREHGKRTAERVLILLLESGVLYSVFWLVAVTSSFAQDINPSVRNGFTVGLPVIFFSMVPQITGIYPTAIIVCVSFQSFTSESLFVSQKNSDSMQFAVRSAESLQIVSTSREHELSSPESVVEVGLALGGDPEKDPSNGNRTSWRTYKIERAF